MGTFFPSCKMRRLGFAADGFAISQLDSQMGLMGGKLPIPSNVTRITQAVKPVDSNGIQQVSYHVSISLYLEILTAKDRILPGRDWQYW